MNPVYSHVSRTGSGPYKRRPAESVGASAGPRLTEMTGARRISHKGDKGFRGGELNWLAKRLENRHFHEVSGHICQVGVVIEVPVKQALLRSVLPDGTVVLLVVLHDDRCAILRNSKTIHEAAGDADGIDDAVQRFMAMTQVSDAFNGGGGDGESAAGASSLRSDVTRRDHDDSAMSPPTSSHLTQPAASPRPSI